MSLEDEKTVKKVLEAQNRLLTQARTLHIAVHYEEDGEHHLDQGQAPFIQHDGHFFIYSSHLSGHIRGLLAHGHTQFMLIEDESASQNIWARVRLKFSAQITEIGREEAIFSSICDRIGKAHGPVMELIRNFTDFHLFRITPQKGVLVTGFAAAYRVKGSSFELVEHLRAS